MIEEIGFPVSGLARIPRAIAGILQTKRQLMCR
jgi:hypothetical protein